MKLKRGFIILAAILLLSGCSGSASSVSQPQQSGAVSQQTEAGASSESSLKVLDEDEGHAPSQEEGPLSGSMLARAARLLDMLQEEGNQLLSPTSLYGALGMAMNGAQGETLDQMEAALGLTAGEINRLFARMEDSGELKTANSIWYRDTDAMGALTPQEAFLSQLKQSYQAQAFPSDFTLPETVERINDWVSEKTEGMIPEILDHVDTGTAMVLVNALLFEGRWISSYQDYQVRREPFYPLKGGERTAEMMYSAEEIYLENDYATGFIKRYQNGYAFAGILPKREGDFTLEELELDSLMESRQSCAVEAAAPKFSFESAMRLGDALQSAGMSDAFDASRADFSRMFVEERQVWISDVIQKTRIEMDQNGTKAAATAVLMAAGMAMVQTEPEKQVVLNRPFAFVIFEEESGLPLFVGKVVLPEG